MIHLEESAGRAIKSLLGETGCQRTIRIELQSSGCCDASLGLRADRVREADIVEALDELRFVISPEVYRMFGEVRISYRDEPGGTGFMITSARPASEWEGFGVSTLKL
jgi:Fe-S cluster assembly iron-binding protein IscA